MECPSCHAAVSEGSRFCDQCGAMMPNRCPSCDHLNQPSARFCAGCGANLTGADAKPSDPASLAEPELAPAPSGPSAERRQLTVMFCDLVGSTALSARLDPEDLRDVIAAYHKCVAQTARRFDGFLAKYMGDGVLVYFGYPYAHEDDAERAVRAALTLVPSVGELHAANAALQVRVGIATGLVVVGDMVGSGEAQERGVVGETPNLAARLQALAEAGSVVISASTRRLVGDLFAYHDLGELHLKGFDGPLRAWRVEGEGKVESRFEALRSVSVPLIGREAEIELLLRRWRQAKEGESQVVLVSGEPGIGKSRLVRDFRERVADEAHSRIFYFGSPYHQNSAFYPVIDQFQRALRLSREDGPEQRLAKLEATLDGLGLPLGEMAPLFAEFLSLAPEARYPPSTLRPSQRRQKTIEGLVAVVEAMAHRRPVLMIVEDAHWIDPSTRDLLDLLVERLRSQRLLVIVTLRAGFDLHLVKRPDTTLLGLTRLSRAESRQVVESIVAEQALPPGLLDGIVDKTDGVPLFVEELTKALLESTAVDGAGKPDAVTAPSAIPASLQDLFMARLDRLGSAREVAQFAAVLGRTFRHEALAAVTSSPRPKLDDSLAYLIRSEIIVRRGTPPDVTYEFRHSLVRDAAYASLLKSVRQRHHRRIAETLTDRFPESAATEPEVLAHHFTEGGLPDQAVTYWHKAAEIAEQRSANAEVVAHANKGLELLAQLPGSPDRNKRELRLLLTLGPALMVLKGYGAFEVARTYDRARDLAVEIGESDSRFAASWGLWLHHQQRGNLQTADRLSRDMLTVAREKTDKGLLLQAHHSAWMTSFFQDLSRCHAHTAEGAALYDFDAHRGHAFIYGGHDPGVCAHGFAGFVQWFLGRPDTAADEARQAIALAERLAHPFTMSLALSMASWVHQSRREPERTIDIAERAIAVCREHDFRHYLGIARILRGWAMSAKGEATAGIKEIREGLVEWEATGARLRHTYFLSLLAEALGSAGRWDEVPSVIARAFAVAEETGERPWLPELYRLKAEALLAGAGNDRGEIDACLRQAVDTARELNARSLELRAATRLAVLLAERGERETARGTLAPVYGAFSEGLGTADLRDAKRLLDQL